VDTIWVVIRCKNNAGVIADTLQSVRRQTVDCRILCIDSGSTDGTAAIADEYANRIEYINSEDYMPGKVINVGMALTTGPLVVFLNSDATPTDRTWLSELVQAASKGKVAAAYGRQIPRSDARPLFAMDTERAFGDGTCAGKWPHFFSMANSIISRAVWSIRPFREDLRYAEDTEWTWWARIVGFEVVYCPRAVVVHSHNYTPRELYARSYGDAYCLGYAIDDPPWPTSFFAQFLLPTAADLVRDTHYCIWRARAPFSLVHSLVFRPAQHLGRFRGYRHGRKDRR
jgi:rhamnosyltransferase